MTILKEAEKFAKKEYKKNDPNHQWTHIKKVMKRASQITKKIKNIDYEILKLAIIFHDINYKSYKTHVDASMKVAKKFLEKENYPKQKINKVLNVIKDHSTPHRRKFGKAKTIEGKIIYDADKSLILTKLETYNKYFPQLYLTETKKLIKKPKK